ncbi:hypothetical protein ACO2Q3_18980 [Caulobacter sp. KR2-114]|uniref:hypothetical protein n=1 Tax=Caulobacter sp. KR2-114 TaxID=3400912 RepID=UPI003C084978
MYLAEPGFELGELRDVDELKQYGRAAVLDELIADGVKSFRKSEISRGELAARAFANALQSWGGDPRTIDLIILASESILPGENAGSEFYDFCSSRGLGKVPVMGVALGECANLAAALRIARSILVHEPIRHIALVTVDVAHDHERIAQLEIGVLSDAAAACIVGASPAGAKYRLCGLSQTANNSLLRVISDEGGKAMLLTAAGVRGAVRAALKEAGAAAPELGGLVCTTLRTSALRFYAQVCGLDLASTFAETVPSIGHAFASDMLINLRESSEWRRSRGIKAGTPLLSLILGPHTWGAAVIEVL